MTRDDWMRIILSASAMPPPLTAEATMMAGVTQPTIMATTCCKARGRALVMGGRPLSSKRLPEVFVFAFIKFNLLPRFELGVFRYSGERKAWPRLRYRPVPGRISSPSLNTCTPRRNTSRSEPAVLKPS